ncbi:chloroperoxidase [Fusarium albosuccineum]|uniref:Chloroperoxidase n=1 Tax=Fusarium albosuccineum TaxID=1237068 RepID=A0A8H4PDV1_9HYPO|nr:chloroperoxidase [Fusarium albosuccineum]
MASPSTPLAKGTYAPSGPNDIRGPCPLINCLANHGYLPRDGRNVRLEEVLAGMDQVGLSKGLGAAFANPIFLERAPSQHHNDPVPQRTFVQNVWHTVQNPWSLLFGKFGMRKPGQEDSEGNRVLNLDQLALPNVVEHDISLTRRDHQQGDNRTPQKDLIDDLLASSKDGKAITAQDLAELRKRRITRQQADNPGCLYGAFQHDLSCAEIALVLNVIGNGESVPCEYARAFFKEERLPVQEGWKRRDWWGFGIVALVSSRNKVKKLIGLDY